MKRKIEELSYKEFKAIVPEKTDLVFLPVGTLEAHGGGAPLGTDIIIPFDLACELAERLNGLVAPPVSYGLTHSLYPYPGSLSLSEDTFRKLIKDIILGFKKNGIKRVVILNGHGGNTRALTGVLQEAGREINVISIDWWILVKDVTREVFGEGGGHAGCDEVSMVYATREDLINPELFEPGDEFEYRQGFYAVPFPGSVILYGGEGSPVFDREKARESRERVLDYLEQFLRTVFEGWGRV